MKKTLLMAAITAALASSVMAQGLVNFSGGTSAATRMSTNSIVGGPSAGLVAGAGSYYFALFASSSQTSINGSTAAISGLSGNYVFNNLGGGTASTGWVLVGIATNNASAGRFQPASQGTASGNQAALNSDNSLTVTGIAGAGAANLVEIGWSASIGTTLAALEAWYAAGAVGNYIGQSAIASVTLGDGGTTATPNPLGTGAGQVGGILLGLTPVPEPGTLALAALGGASLLLFRRKK
ncbi:MAG: PEP-CTERM sorting domain-containing protein [Rouxiella aceris]|uniref:PEP-CTERM sorting domain-containing protein n=1 Tax=Rouxiella aceris TaxID=2703884 RepID=UPI00283F2F8F|nr:PEP-CTERM sorting domain-containing protein [Rouxiella aceris]MDR3430763.1 PEP-CTERM sorting domain-containing protein [Rouxiella aceris]